MGDPDCIFCKIVAGDLPASIVDEDERTIAFMDIAPATRGHALVIPRAHSQDLLSVPEEDLRATIDAARRLADGVPFPRARDSALRRRPAAAALGAGSGRGRSDGAVGKGTDERLAN